MSVFSDVVADFIHDYLWLGNSLENPGNFEHYVLENSPCAGFLPTGCVESTIMHPADNDRIMRICTISDTHDRHYLFENIPTCDILIHTGDIFMRGRWLSPAKSIKKLRKFNEWLGSVPSTHRLVIGGNHDKVLEDLGVDAVQAILTNATYLCNSSTSISGLTIWGSPLSHGRSANAAFQTPEFEASAIEKLRQLELAKQRVDILVTHGPCPHIGEQVKPRIMHVSGHVHRDHGVRATKRRDHADGAPRRQWYRVSAPIMDQDYQPTQLPIVVDFALPNSRM